MLLQVAWSLMKDQEAVFYVIHFVEDGLIPDKKINIYKVPTSSKDLLEIIEILKSLSKSKM